LSRMLWCCCCCCYFGPAKLLRQHVPHFAAHVSRQKHPHPHPHSQPHPHPHQGKRDRRQRQAQTQRHTERRTATGTALSSLMLGRVTSHSNIPQDTQSLLKFRRHIADDSIALRLEAFQKPHSKKSRR